MAFLTFRRKPAAGRGIFTLLTALVFCLTLAQTADAARKKKAAKPRVDRYASIVIDASSGIPLSERNSDKPLYPASLTKMMTLYLTFEAIANGDLRKNSRLNVSSRAAMQEPSKLNLKPGSTIRVEDAILALVTKSANDVAVVLAEGIGGSESRFAQMMTQKARALGMRNTRFVNASGLHTPSQVSTARDMAILSQALIRDYPRDYLYFKTANFTYAGVRHRNHNRLMETYPGMDGLKTGYVYASGYNLAASAVQGGRRLIGVVFGGQTTVSRNKHMADILDTAFSRARQPQVAAQLDRKAAASAATASATTRAKTTVAVAEPLPFDALGLLEEQGDTDDGQRYRTDEVKALARDLQPRPVNIIRAGENNMARDYSSARVINAPRPKPAQNTHAPAPLKTASAAAAGGWAVQVGAFSTHESGMSALRGVRDKLPRNITASGQYLIAPLMTSRGMIYRARLGGLDRDQATSACRLLKGNCLILAVQ